MKRTLPLSKNSITISLGNNESLHFFSLFYHEMFFNFSILMFCLFYYHPEVSVASDKHSSSISCVTWPHPSRGIVVLPHVVYCSALPQETRFSFPGAAGGAAPQAIAPSVLPLPPVPAVSHGKRNPLLLDLVWPLFHLKLGYFSDHVKPSCDLLHIAHPL